MGWARKKNEEACVCPCVRGGEGAGEAFRGLANESGGFGCRRGEGSCKGDADEAHLQLIGAPCMLDVTGPRVPHSIPHGIRLQRERKHGEIEKMEPEVDRETHALHKSRALVDPQRRAPFSDQQQRFSKKAGAAETAPVPTPQGSPEVWEELFGG